MIPSNWNKVPLENFVHYLEYKDEEPETLEDRFDLIYKKTCAILGCSVKEAKALDVEQQQALVKLFSVELPTLLPLQFRHKGITYRPIIQAKKLTGYRYSAIKNAAKRGLNNNLHQVMFNISQPVKYGFKKSFPFIGWKPYDFKDDEIGDRVEDFKTLPMEVVNPVTVFFLSLSKSLSDLLSDYSLNQLKKMTEDMAALQVSLESDMDGLQ